MVKANTDIDIDVADRSKILKGLDHVVATINRDGKLHKHNTGVYFQNISVNPLTNFAQIGDKEAEALGFFKIDFLNVHFYNDIRDEEHLVKLMETEPMWELLEHEEIVTQLFHINNYYDLCNLLKPKSVMQLAMLLAVRLPSKSHLRTCTWKEIEKTVWDKPADGSYYFKKSHSISYALAIVVQLNLLVEQLNKPKIPLLDKS